MLGRPFGEVLDSGELRIAISAGKFFIQYYESAFPLAPKSYRRVLIHRDRKLKESLGEETAAYQEYSGILASLASLFRDENTALESPADKRLKFEAIRGRLRQLGEPLAAKSSEFMQANIAGIQRQARRSSELLPPGSSSLGAILQARLLAEHQREHQL